MPRATQVKERLGALGEVVVDLFVKGGRLTFESFLGSQSDWLSEEDHRPNTARL